MPEDELDDLIEEEEEEDFEIDPEDELPLADLDEEDEL